MGRTRERILDSALQLFNQQGTAPVSTNHIAEALGISPGNLYYHFRSKEQIISALFERLFERWETMFEAPTDRPPDLDDMRRLVRANFGVMQEYRFVYRELVALLRRDPELGRRYAEVRQRGFQGFRGLFEVFVTSGALRAASPVEVDNLAQLIWLVSEFWLPSLELDALPVDEANLRRGEELMLELLRLYTPSPEH